MFQNELLINGQCLACPAGAPANYLFECVEACDNNAHNFGDLECHDSVTPSTAGNGCDQNCNL